MTKSHLCLESTAGLCLNDAKYLKNNLFFLCIFRRQTAEEREQERQAATKYFLSMQLGSLGSPNSSSPGPPLPPAAAAAAAAASGNSLDDIPRSSTSSETSSLEVRPFLI